MSNSWPTDVLDILSDPIFDDVRPLTMRITTDERIQRQMQEVNDWIESHGREPQRESKEIKEKLLATRLQALKEQGLWQ